MFRPTIKPNKQYTFHRDGSVSYWSVSLRIWNRRYAHYFPSHDLPTLSQKDRDRIRRIFETTPDPLQD